MKNVFQGWTALGLAAALLAGSWGAASAAGEAYRPLDSGMDAFRLQGDAQRSHWVIGTAKMSEENPRELVVQTEGKELVNAKGGGVDIYTDKKFGDCTVELEVMVPRGSNSGIYLMGQYEIQVLDSYGKEKVGPGDMGGIYGAAPPVTNAAGPPGEWQTYRIEFRAPRFENGQKVENARFLKVVLNGTVIHENVEVKGSTGGALPGGEVPEGPLMFQGDHGPVAYRNIVITPAK